MYINQMKKEQGWCPTHWLSYETKQIPAFVNLVPLLKTMAVLCSLPAIIETTEILHLNTLLSNFNPSKQFLLQIGDCVESFSMSKQAVIFEKMDFLIRTKNFLADLLKKEIILLGRIAGQYAKPRTQEYEIFQGKKCLSYRGDLINSIDQYYEARIPNARSLLKAYRYSKRIKNYLDKNPDQIFTSHEGLCLYYESALTRRDRENHWYNTSTHFPWIGVRTIIKSKAHIEYFRGIRNPIGIKVGVDTDVGILCEIINSFFEYEAKRIICLITRFGILNVRKYLPIFIEKLGNIKFKCLWLCDPMHGNTLTTLTGRKYRLLGSIYEEVKVTAEILRKFDIALAGLHLEATYEDVVECVESVDEITVIDYPYTSLLDPRLNQMQIKQVLKEATIR